MERVRIHTAAFKPSALAEEFRSHAGDIGAVASFAGYVRSEGGGVQSLRLSHYPGMTEAEIERIIAQAVKRWPITNCHVTHRVGDILQGEAIVFVTAASAHRRAAFEAVDFLMDYLKSEAPFWKQEIVQGKAVWIEPKQNDKRDIQRWNKQD